MTGTVTPKAEPSPLTYCLLIKIDRCRRHRSTFDYEGCLVKEFNYSAAAALADLRRLLFAMKDRPVPIRVRMIMTTITPVSLKCSSSIPVIHISGQKPRKVEAA